MKSAPSPRETFAAGFDAGITYVLGQIGHDIWKPLLTPEEIAKEFRDFLADYESVV